MSGETEAAPVAGPSAIEEARTVIGGVIDAWPVYVPPTAPAPPTTESEPGAATEWDEIDYLLAREPLNDAGNAARLMRRFGRDLMFIPGIGWHAWREVEETFYWDRETGDNEALNRAQDTAAAMSREAAALIAAFRAKAMEEARDEEEDAEIADAWTEKPGAKKAERRKRPREAGDIPEWVAVRAHALREYAVVSGNLGKLNAMLSIAEGAARVSIDDVDAAAEVLSVANGTLDLNVPSLPGGMRFRPARREDRITRVCRWRYDPEAEAPTWRYFLGTSVPDPEVMTFLQRWAGYCLTGRSTHQVVVMLTGAGSNGKSVFVETLEHGFGTLTLRLPFESLTRDDRKRGSEPTPDVARLPGVRMAVAVEPDEGTTFSTGMLKKLTERKSITARHLNMPFFDFTPCHKLMLMFNEKPNVPSSDDGTWRRINVVHWPVMFIDKADRARFPDAPLKDLTLPDRLLEELPGIFNWALDGLRMEREIGLAQPPAVLAATAAYRAESDPVGEFCRAVIVRASEDAFETGKRMYDAFLIWAELSGVAKMSNAKFGKKLKMIFRAETSGYVKYFGIRIDPDWWGEHGSHTVAS